MIPRIERRSFEPESAESPGPEADAKIDEVRVKSQKA